MNISVPEVTSVAIGDIVDFLGTIKAGIATMKAEEEARKAQVIGAAAETGLRVFEGNLFRATVSFTDKTVTDWPEVVKALAEVAGLTNTTVNYFIREFTKKAEGVPCVRVVARKVS